ncbi:hypothetical protein [Arthrobacter sp. B3I9]|uniref:hypothetical protein n=1 Tax=Arthrobacter sp. B3I9 TaxID=3042270 RepID=UPI00358DF695
MERYVFGSYTALARTAKITSPPHLPAHLHALLESLSGRAPLALPVPISKAQERLTRTQAVFIDGLFSPPSRGQIWRSF